MCHHLIFISNFIYYICCLFDEETDLVMVQWVQTQFLLTSTLQLRGVIADYLTFYLREM